MSLRTVVIVTLIVASAGLALSTHLASNSPGPSAPDLPAPPAAQSPASPPPVPAAPRVTSIELRRGDSFVKALSREGVDQSVSATIANMLIRSGVNLRKLKPTDTLSVTWSLDGTPVAVTYEPGPWLGFAVVATDGRWEVKRSEIRPDVRVEAVSGEVKRSLFEAIETAGESPQLVIDLVEIFSSEFDFTADTRSGDRFRLLVEKRYAGDQFVDYGRILAAQYETDAARLTGIGYERRGGTYAFYDQDGRSLKKGFLKSPLEFTRITSGFTYARPHPILGGVRPHLAIDYAAPVGTPVRAVADGHISVAGWNGGNGISVTLRHRLGYETMYNHLSRLGPGVRAGSRIRQRQVVGFVGSTGLSTGPHLDYRIARNGQFVNPLKEKFIPGDPIAGAERGQFLAHAKSLIRTLEEQAPF